MRVRNGDKRRQETFDRAFAVSWRLVPHMKNPFNANLGESRFDTIVTIRGMKLNQRFFLLIWSSSISFPDSTCCKIASGGYDCCPLSDAVCCPSGLYCCPSGSSCNEKDGSCTMAFPQTLNLRPRFMMSSNNKNRTSSFPDQFERKQKNLGTEGNNKCPDKEQECGEKETCCKLQSGGFGCCPYPGEFLSSINLR